MKYQFIIITLLIAIASCQSEKKMLTGETPREDVNPGDTVYLNSGVKYLFVDKSSDTTSITPGTSLTVHINLYVGEKLVWNTYDPFNPMPFTYKVDSMIPGFDEVIQYLKNGDRVTAIIPPEMGYGAGGRGPLIPPHSTLTFDIKVIEISEN